MDKKVYFYIKSYEILNKVHFIQPYAIDKNIGKAYNESCALIPDGDWICITDHDSMFLLPNSKKQIIEIAQTTDFELLGCMTNRLNPKMCKEQVLTSMFEQYDIMDHYNMALTLHNNYYGMIKPTDAPIAGMCMLFRKETWKKRPFIENSVYFDQEFSKGLKRGIMQGVYMLHFYRMDKNYRDYSHLK